MANVYVKTDPTTAAKGYIPGGAPSNIKPSANAQISGAPSYIRTTVDTNVVNPATGQKAKNAREVAEITGVKPTDIKTYSVQPTITYKPQTSNDSSGSSGGYYGGGSNSGGGGESYSGGGGDYSPAPAKTDYESEILEKIQELLNEQKTKADEYLKTQYEQQLAQNRQAFEANRDQLNVNRERGERYIGRMYDPRSMSGVSNKVRNYQNWSKNIAANRLSYTNNDATARANYNSGLANNASTLAQGWYNYVLPVYTNRQNYSDSLANQRQLQSMDLDYRKYLAGLGV